MLGSKEMSRLQISKIEFNNIFLTTLEKQGRCLKICF
ncbi:unnamed protein product [Paramecium octaurelia]|uniref:Uncharacterized protein n=1 Tax=Paramecium octaurelia TaxID=43137 RepID=A0A8S1TZQ6_PAROT|nr:unnamed protein product [Paramecium octaurelia]